MIRSLSKPVVTIATFIVTLSPVYANEVVTTDSGRQVRLNADGSWDFISANRYATSKDGQRIELRPDGSWRVVRPDAERAGKTEVGQELVSNAPGVQASVQPSISAGVTELQFLLNDVEVLKKKTKLKKSTRLDSRMVFNVQLINHSSTALDLGEVEKEYFRASASSGEKFKIKSVQSSVSALAAGESTNITVTASGSPKWFGVKYLSLVVRAGAFGQPVKTVLQKNMDEVASRTVKDF